MTWIQTISGRRFDFMSPDPKMVSLGDIAHSLAHLDRFVGHIAIDGYSVAEHSVLVTMLVEHWIATDEARAWGVSLEEARREALGHDAHEAYDGDMSAPRKQALAQMCTELGIANVEKKLTARTDGAVRTALGMLPAMPQIVADADFMILGAEAYDCLDGRQTAQLASLWSVDVAALSAKVPRHCRPRGLSPAMARKWFLGEAERVGLKEVL